MGAAWQKRKYPVMRGKEAEKCARRCLRSKPAFLTPCSLAAVVWRLSRLLQRLLAAEGRIRKKLVAALEDAYQDAASAAAAAAGSMASTVPGVGSGGAGASAVAALLAVRGLVLLIAEYVC